MTALGRGTAGGRDAAGGGVGEPGATGGRSAASGSTATSMPVSGPGGRRAAGGGAGAGGGLGTGGGLGGGGSCSVSTAAPHEPQNLAPSSRSDAHSGHAFISGDDARERRVRSCAHAPQACDPGGTAAPQDGQNRAATVRA